MIGVDMARTHRRVRAVIKNSDVVGLPSLEPLYGIRRFTVDPELEIEGWRPSWRGADAADLSTGLYSRSRLHADSPEIAIERVVIAAVVEDHQGAQTGKGVRVRHRSTVYRPDRKVFRRGDLDAVFDGASTQPAFGLAEPAADPARRRPFERATEGEQRDIDSVATALGGFELLLDLVVGHLQFAHV